MGMEILFLSRRKYDDALYSRISFVVFDYLGLFIYRMAW